MPGIEELGPCSSDAPQPCCSRSTLRRWGAILAMCLGFSVVPARAADAPVPVTQPAAADPCASYGTGFILLPRTRTCVKVAASALLEYKLDLVDKDFVIETQRLLGTPVALYDKAAPGGDAGHIEPRLDFQAGLLTATPTPFGALVTFVNVHDGQNITAAFERGGSSTTVTDQHVFIDQAWASFAGFTAGLKQSIFDYSTGFTYSGGYGSNRYTESVGYTQPLGSLANVSVAVEDPANRRYQEGVWARYASPHSPDVVTRLRIAPPWGALQLSSAIHPIDDLAGKACCGSTHRVFGWAGMGAVEYRTKWSNVFGPIAGETYGRFLLTAAYTQGALDYLGLPQFTTDYIADIDGSLRRTSAYSAIASYEHVWLPNLKSTLGFSIYDTNTRTQNFIWKTHGYVAQLATEVMPIKDVAVGAELDYYHDAIRGIFFDIPGDRQKTGFFNVFAYVRWRV